MGIIISLNVHTMLGEPWLKGILQTQSSISCLALSLFSTYPQSTSLAKSNRESTVSWDLPNHQATCMTGPSHSTTGNVKWKLRSLVTNSNNNFLNSSVQAQDKDSTISYLPAVRGKMSAWSAQPHHSSPWQGTRPRWGRQEDPGTLFPGASWLVVGSTFSTLPNCLMSPKGDGGGPPCGGHSA